MWARTTFATRISSLTTDRGSVDQIRAALSALSEKSHLIPRSALWEDVDLQRAPSDSEFRACVAQQTFDDRVFAQVSFTVQDVGLCYWLKRYCDDVTGLGKSQYVFPEY